MAESFGSGAVPDASHHQICANIGNKKTGPCQNNGSIACRECRLVVYCSTNCQDAHSGTHKNDCSSPLRKPEWKPAYIRQHRDPAFMAEATAPTEEVFRSLSLIPNNAPAFDLVKMRDNEGEDFEGPMNLLFAASGDLRSIIASVGALPSKYKGSVDVVANDAKFEVVARNAIILLIFLASENADDAADCALHLMYSAFINKSHIGILKDKIKPLIQAVCDSTASKDNSALLSKVWTFGERRLRLVITRKHWVELLNMLGVPKNMDLAEAKMSRHAVINTQEQVDLCEHLMVAQMAGQRMCTAKFRADGILLPFGAPRNMHTIPNPLFFRRDGTWALRDTVDPMADWSITEVSKAYNGKAVHDMYGALHQFVLHRCRDFHEQITARTMSFGLHNTDTRLLRDLIPHQRFDRIDASNIADLDHVGIASALRSLAPLLRDPATNDKATLVTLFLDVGPEHFMDFDNPLLWAAEAHALRPKIEPYAKYPSMPSRKSHKQVLDEHFVNFRRFQIARQMACDMDNVFDRYVRTHRFVSIGVMERLQMKANHSIIGKWPLRFSFGPATDKAKKEFGLRLGSGYAGWQRYVEWKAIVVPVIENV